MEIANDEDVWFQTHPDDLWIFDKLILSHKLGYVCGGRGMIVPAPNKYIVRPCINFLGMGIGAEIKYIKKYTEDKVPDGFFWCELFSGRHLSVDYYRGKQMLCVEGIRGDKISKWKRWEKTNDRIEMPTILHTLKGKYDWINVEYIDGNIIEIHLRKNPDFYWHDSSWVEPVWRGEKVDKKRLFIPCEDAERLGFYIEEVK